MESKVKALELINRRPREILDSGLRRRTNEMESKAKALDLVYSHSARVATNTRTLGLGLSAVTKP
jgi:hypothetical protein